jgi:hypothetical protein
MLRTSTIIPFVLLALPASAQLTVTAVSPARHTLAGTDVEIVIDFDRPLIPLPSAEVRVFGSNTGPVSGLLTLENGDTRLRIANLQPYHAGEVITLELSHDLLAQDGTLLRDEGYAHRFGIVSAPAAMEFTTLDVFSVRDQPNTLVRIYGAQGVDLDTDGHIDLALVNEVSSDIRVVLSKADGSGTFHPFLTPTNQTGSTPSPNEAADFDGDGRADLATANTGASTCSILLGNGDGTFGPRTDYPIGAGLHGLAVLDVDGDGDTDVAGCSTGSGYVGVLLNDGAGGFGSLTTFEGGGSGEYGLSAQDMNNDGIMDLVVGLRTSQRIAVHLGNGDGTFTPAGNVPCGGGVWMIVCGDVNGDGNMDVSSANGASGSGSILLGDGAGGLALVQTFDAGSFTTATDLGDLDGDGDPDWVLSDFGSGRWTLLENDGNGAFSQVRTFTAVDNPACALMLDLENDGDLDLVLLDEIADLVRLERNDSPGTTLCFGDGSGVTPCPCGNTSTAGTQQGCANSTGAGATLVATGSASVASDDLELHVARVPAGQFGLVFSGTLETHVPFGDGLRCLGGTLLRYPATATGAGGFTQSNLASLGAVAPGDSRWFQCWYRDPFGPCGTNYNGSSAMLITFLP